MTPTEAASTDRERVLREALDVERDSYLECAESLGMRLMDGSLSVVERAAIRGRCDRAIAGANRIRALAQSHREPKP